jgi:hypothetical protein
MAKVRGEINCDSCSGYFDGDLADLLAKTNTHGLTDPAKIRELTYFWLCAECAVHYPNGAKDFFVKDYFEIVPLCARGCGEEVESENYVCEDCEDGVI